MDSDNFDNDNLMQNESEMLPKTPMYEAKLVAWEGCMQQHMKQDVSTKANTPLSIDFHRFSSLTKLLRVAALAQKLISKLKRTNRSNSYIDNEESIQAVTLWTRYVQELHYGDVIDAIQNKHNNMKQQLGIY